MTKCDSHKTILEDMFNRKVKRNLLASGAVFTLCIYLVYLNCKFATAMLHRKISKYLRGETDRNYDLKSLSKYFVGKEGTLWSKQFLNVNNNLAYKGGRTLKPETFKNIMISSTIPHCSRQRFLVYKCDSSRLCGGWGDRQKGIVGTFLLALLTNRVFVIDMDNPCNMENILLPNNYNWLLCYNYVKSVPAYNVLQSSYIDDVTKIGGIRNFDFDRKWSKQVVVVRVNSFLINEVRQHSIASTRLKWLLNVTNEEAIHLVLHTLFKPTVKLLKEAGEFYEKQIKGRQLICSHIRVGKNPSIPSDINLRYGAPNETALLQFLKLLEKNSSNAVYIASDSEAIKELAREHIKSYININRTIVHVDRLGKFQRFQSEACEGLATVIFEQFILSVCDTLLLTRSGLGTMAAYLRGVDENLFIFHPSTCAIEKSNLTDLQRSFQFL